ncbi:hypothetical protein HYU40_03480 [Candidatus Woesearchaeota archaeon]|nr:hypothetical protein [Candidatus Woesearchaeota archaeon]
MVTTETVLVNLLGAVAYGAGAYLAVEYVLPKVKIIAAEVLRYPKTAEALVFLLSVLVYIAAAQGIITKLAGLGVPYINNLTVINPAIDVLNGIAPVVKMVLVGIGIVLLAERVRLRA